MDVHDSRDGEDLQHRVLQDELIALLLILRDTDETCREELDQAHEADHSHAWLALLRGPDGDGLHAEVLHSGGGRHVKRDTAALLDHLAAVRRGNHDCVGVDFGDAEVPAQVNQIQGSQIAGYLHQVHVAGAANEDGHVVDIGTDTKCSQTSVIAVWGWASLAGVWLPLTRCFQPARWNESTM